MTNFLQSLSKSMGDKYSAIAEDGIVGDSSTYYLDSGSYALNAVISGSIFKGLPSNKRMLFAGAEATGKTYFALNLAKLFLDDHDDSYIIYFDTEKAIDNSLLEARGIDKKRVLHSQPSTIEEFRTYAKRALDEYAQIDEKKRPKFAIFLDSMGMLSSEAEIQNMADGKNVADMKKAQLLKATFRALTLQMGLLNVPLIVVGHTYKAIGSFIPLDEVAGGSGAKYASDTIVTLTKSKEKEGTQQVGVNISVTVYKSRAVRQGTKVKTTLLFERGLDKYSGLLEIAEAAGVFNKKGNKYEIEGIEGTHFGSHIKKEPEKYFTQEVLEKIDVWVQRNFKLSSESNSEEYMKILNENE